VLGVRLLHSHGSTEERRRRVEQFNSRWVPLTADSTSDSGFSLDLTYAHPGHRDRLALNVIARGHVLTYT
jgi:hypothetical protein